MKIIDELFEKIELSTFRKIILLSSIVIFIISLTQNFYYSTSGDESSIVFFLFGFIGLFWGVVSWFANPFLIYSWIHIKNNERSTILSLFSLLLACLFMIYKKVGSSEIVSYELGYWLWLLSICVTCFGNLVIGFKLKKDNK